MSQTKMTRYYSRHFLYKITSGMIHIYMKRILIIQFRTNPNTISEERESFLRALRPVADIEVMFKNAFLDNFNWEKPEEVLGGAQGVILGGSGEFDFDGGRNEDDEKKIASHLLTESMRPFLNYLEEYHFPTLAVCFGHQIIAQSMGVSVINDKTQAKVGSHKVSLTDEAYSDKVFGSLPDVFVVQYGHKDSLSALPNGAILMAQGEQCLYSAIRHGENRYSVQFHPELDADDVRQKFASHPDYLPEGLTPDDLTQDSPFAKLVLVNFVNSIV